MVAFIREYADMVPRDVCVTAIARLDHTAAAIFPTVAMRIDLLDEWAEVTKVVHEAVLRAIDRYSADCPTFAVHRRVLATGYTIERRAPSTAWRAPTTIVPRPILAVALFLDDDGELEFEEQPDRVPRHAGAIAMFPTGFEFVFRESIARPSCTMTTSLTFATDHG